MRRRRDERLKVAPAPVPAMSGKRSQLMIAMLQMPRAAYALAVAASTDNDDDDDGGGGGGGGNYYGSRDLA